MHFIDEVLKGGLRLFLGYDDAKTNKNVIICINTDKQTDKMNIDIKRMEINIEEKIKLRCPDCGLKMDNRKNNIWDCIVCYNTYTLELKKSENTTKTNGGGK